MVRVLLGGTLKNAAGGESEFDLDADTIQVLLRQLGEQCPKLEPLLERGVAVSIDGVIHRNAWFQPVPPEAEVYILPRLGGG
jgi:molybdopterin converting factor small subunit